MVPMMLPIDFAKDAVLLRQKAAEHKISAASCFFLIKYMASNHDAVWSHIGTGPSEMGIASDCGISVDGLLRRLHAACLRPSDIPHNGSVAYRSELPRCIDDIRNAVGIPRALHPVHHHRADGYLAVVRLIASLCQIGRASCRERV